MKIGIFDSGLGGLYLLKAITEKLPKYDYVFLGDTKNLPYGDKTQKQVYKLTSKAVDFLFEQNCALVILACNTASVEALRKIQTEYLPKKYPNRRVLGVVVPTLEVIRVGDVCVLATLATSKSKAYSRELKKLNPKSKVYEISSPELVPLIETHQLAKLSKAVAKYSDLIQNKKVKNLILGCTHYALLKKDFATKLGSGIKVISQDEIIPAKLKDYLYEHEELEQALTKKRERKFYVTKLTKELSLSSKKWFGKKVELRLAKY